MIKWRLWLAIGVAGVSLVLVAGILAYRWGYSEAKARLAAAREEAVREAVVADRRERAVEELRASEREQRRIAELRAEVQALEGRTRRSREIETSEGGQRQCLTDEQLEAYRSF